MGHCLPKRDPSFTSGVLKPLPEIIWASVPSPGHGAHAHCQDRSLEEALRWGRRTRWRSGSSGERGAGEGAWVWRPGGTAAGVSRDRTSRLRMPRQELAISQITWMPQDGQSPLLGCLNMIPAVLGRPAPWGSPAPTSPALATPYCAMVGAASPLKRIGSPLRARTSNTWLALCPHPPRGLVGCGCNRTTSPLSPQTVPGAAGRCHRVRRVDVCQAVGLLPASSFPYLRWPPPSARDLHCHPPTRVV